MHKVLIAVVLAGLLALASAGIAVASFDWAPPEANVSASLDMDVASGSTAPVIGRVTQHPDAVVVGSLDAMTDARIVENGQHRLGFARLTTRQALSLGALSLGGTAFVLYATYAWLLPAIGRRSDSRQALAGGDRTV